MDIVYYHIIAVMRKATARRRARPSHKNYRCSKHERKKSLSTQ